MRDIISIGSATKDVYLISKDFKLIRSQKFPDGLGECFAYGAKVEVGDVHFDIGGGAANSAHTFSNLGLGSAIISRVGKDIYGEEIKSGLQKKGIDVSLLASDRENKTAYSTILVMPNSDRTVLVYRGASARFSAGDFPFAKMKAPWYYISSIAGDFNLLERIFSFAVKNKIKIAWNPGSRELNFTRAQLYKLMKNAYVFNINKEEAEKLTGKKDIKEIFKQLDNLSSGYNIVTDGKNGAYLSDGKVIYFAPALAVKIYNTTGAGDAFGSGFVAGLILKNDWDYALRLAMLNACGVLSQMGAHAGLLKGLPNKKELDKVKIRIKD